MAAQVSRSVLAKIVSAVSEGDLELEVIRRAAGLPERIFREACALLASNQVGVWSEEVAVFRKGDKMKAALLLCRLGEPIDEVSKSLSWSEFEDFAAELLEGVGYTVRRRIRLREPRCEVDVVAAKEDLALVIDCKHWRKAAGAKAMCRVVEAQINRVKALAASNPSFLRGCDKLLPVVLTLYSGGFLLLRGVPIVPINLLSDFVSKIRGYIGELNITCY